MAKILKFPDRSPPKGVTRSSLSAERTALSSAVGEALAKCLAEVRGFDAYGPTCGLQAFDYDRFEDGVVESSRTSAPAVPSIFASIGLLRSLRSALNHAIRESGLPDVSWQLWVDLRVLGYSYTEVEKKLGWDKAKRTYWLREVDKAVAGYVPLRLIDRRLTETLLKESIDVKLSQTVLAKELRSAGYRPELPIECYEDGTSKDAVFIAVDARGVHYQRQTNHPGHMWMRIEEQEEEEVQTHEEE